MTAAADIPERRDVVASGDYIHAMAQHVSSVCVIATAIGSERFGLTATAVTSVCADPPRLLVCVNKSNLTHQKIFAAGAFSVNVLTEAQDEIAKAFAGIKGRAVDKFAYGSWSALKTGAPVLADTAASFDCVLAQALDQFSHTIFFGDVLAVTTRPGEDTLLYGARKFRRLRRVFLSLDSDETLHF